MKKIFLDDSLSLECTLKEQNSDLKLFVTHLNNISKVNVVCLFV